MGPNSAPTRRAENADVDEGPVLAGGRQDRTSRIPLDAGEQALQRRADHIAVAHPVIAWLVLDPL